MDSNQVGSAFNKVYVKENPATYLVSDAEFVLNSALSADARGDEQAATRLSRVAILLYAVCLEGFINFVYEYSGVPASAWNGLSFKDKWSQAAHMCLRENGVLHIDDVVVYRPGDKVETFHDQVEPFPSFLELKAFRNSALHLKPPFAMVKEDQVDEHLGREEYYPCSGLPKRLRDCRLEHAQIAQRIYRDMTKELDRQMKGIILGLFESEGGAWIESIDEDDRVWEDEA